MKTELSIADLATLGEKIEDLVYQYDISWIEAALMFCEQHDMEIDNLGSMIQSNQYLKAKIEEEAAALNFIPKKAQLQF